jgi:Mn-dependent DtxR family transcriptional regulator
VKETPEIPYLRLSPTLENSIKAIVKLDPHGYGTKCIEIAELLGITKPSVTQIIKRLLEKGLIPERHVDREIRGSLHLI